MNKSVEFVVSKLVIIGNAIEEEFNNWHSLECMPFETLVENLTNKLNWSKDDYNKNKAIIRWYVHEHDKWTSVRGAKGGAQRIEIVEAKKQALDKKQAIKNEVLEKIKNAFNSDEK